MSNLANIKCLETSIKKNLIALDTVKNWKNSVEGSLAYQEGDKQAYEDFDSLSYLEFTLEWLDKMYNKTYKQSGGKKVFICE